MAGIRSWWVGTSPCAQPRALTAFWHARGMTAAVTLTGRHVGTEQKGGAPRTALGSLLRHCRRSELLTRPRHHLPVLGAPPFGNHETTSEWFCSRRDHRDFNSSF